MKLIKKYGSPALANLRGQSMIAAPRTARLKVTKKVSKPLPTYRGSFSVTKNK